VSVNATSVVTASPATTTAAFSHVEAHTALSTGDAERRAAATGATLAFISGLGSVTETATRGRLGNDGTPNAAT